MNTIRAYSVKIYNRNEIEYQYEACDVIIHSDNLITVTSKDGSSDTIRLSSLWDMVITHYTPDKIVK